MTLTMWPPPLGDHLSNDGLSDVEEPGQVHGHHRRVVVRRVVDERLADEDPGVVDQGVDPSEVLERQLDDPLGGLGVGDVPRHGEQAGIVGGGHRARRAHHRVTGGAKGSDNAGPDPLRGAGDDRDSW